MKIGALNDDNICGLITGGKVPDFPGLFGYITTYMEQNLGEIPPYICSTVKFQLISKIKKYQ